MIPIIIIIFFILISILKILFDYYKYKKSELIKSNTSFNKLLPIGTIIKRNNDDKLYMINNYRGAIYIKKSVLKTIDYWCLEYPLGTTDDNYNYININTEEISKVIYLGYDDEIRQKFMNDKDLIKEEK